MDDAWEGSAILTIGYGNRSMDEFISLLKRYEVAYLIDVRSKPYSRYRPEFSRPKLEGRLETSGIRYVFMGDSLGGLPVSDEFRDTDGKVDYVKLRASDEFGAGIERLKHASAQGLTVALMCSEGDPRRCHRSHLIGVTLSEAMIDVKHIDELGDLISQDEAEQMNKPEQPSLGIDVGPRKGSRKTYGVRSPNRPDDA